MKRLVALSLTLRVGKRQRPTLRQRVRNRWLRWLRKHLAKAVCTARDIEQVEIDRIASTIDRLEMAARIGSSEAAQALATMAIDTIGVERRRLANEALSRLRQIDVRFR